MHSGNIEDEISKGPDFSHSHGSCRPANAQSQQGALTVTAEPTIKQPWYRTRKFLVTERISAKTIFIARSLAKIA
jgi:hypothetical protein